MVEVARLLAERHIQRIGLRLEGNSWEYPLWPLTARIAGRQLEHVQVPDPIGQLAHAKRLAGFTPQAVVAIETPVAAQGEFVLGSRTFRAVFHEGEVTLFVSD
jgi:allophanate hydrolase subunit 2